MLWHDFLPCLPSGEHSSALDYCRLTFMINWTCRVVVSVSVSNTFRQKCFCDANFCIGRRLLWWLDVIATWSVQHSSSDIDLWSYFAWQIVQVGDLLLFWAPKRNFEYKLWTKMLVQSVAAWIIRIGCGNHSIPKLETVRSTSFPVVIHNLFSARWESEEKRKTSINHWTLVQQQSEVSCGQFGSPAATRSHLVRKDPEESSHVAHARPAMNWTLRFVTCLGVTTKLELEAHTQMKHYCHPMWLPRSDTNLQLFCHPMQMQRSWFDNTTLTDLNVDLTTPVWVYAKREKRVCVLCNECKNVNFP